MDIKLIVSSKTDSYELIQLAESLGINERSFKLLIEAFRRKNLSAINKDILGYGTPSKYKDKFFKAINKNDVVSHKNTSWTLTKRGIDTLAILENAIVIPPSKEVKIHLSNIIRKLEICA